MFDDSLQQVVDVLAEQLGRSVAIDDPDLHLMAASQHFGDEDNVRLHSLLSRQMPVANRRFVMSQGVARWTEPGRLKASDAFGAKARVCAPVRLHGELLGYLWLIDAEDDLRPSELARTTEAVEQAAVVLYRAKVEHERERAREEALVRNLLTGEVGERRDAQQVVERERLLLNTQRVTVVVVEVHVAGEEHHDDPESVLRSCVEQAVRPLTMTSGLYLVEGARAIIVLGSGAAGQVSLERVGDRIVSAVEKALGPPSRCVVGIGSACAGMGEARTSYQQALQATRASTLLASHGPVVAYDDLGIYGILLPLVPDDPRQTSYPDSVMRLLREDPAGKLLGTVEVFLDEAGNAAGAAAQLHIHRTTLYYRLHRLEEIAGVDLNSGHDRLALHLGIKLAHLAGALRAHHRLAEGGR